MSYRVLARKYADAFYGFSPDICSIAILDMLKQVSVFFSEHKEALFLLNLPQLKLQIKNDALRVISQEIGLSSEINQLFMLLIVHKRANLIPQVCMH